MIKVSTDWVMVETSLWSTTYTKISNIDNRTQIYLMLKNIGKSIDKLSKAEVLARQGRKEPARTLLIKINEDIEMVEEYLLVAALIG